MNKQFKWGRLALVTGFMMALSPYLYHFAFITYLLGVILVLFSKKGPILMAMWILIPIMLLGGLYLFQTKG